MKHLLICLILLSFFGCQSDTKKSDGQTETVKASMSNQKSNSKPKNIILMVGDGMGITQITAGLYSNGNQLNLERFPVIGLHKPYASDDLITDSAAGATAFSVGEKTYNGAIGVLPDTSSKQTILELAASKGYATGLVATSEITHATPASFIAHQASRDMHEAIAADFLKTEIDLFIGGGKKYFDDREEDDRNLIEELNEKGYSVSTFIDQDLDQVNMKVDKLVYFTANTKPLPVAQGRTYLPFASKTAAQFLNKKSDKGFFLMIEGSQIDWGGHANNSEYIVTEMLDFDRSLGHILDFAEKDGETLVIVTADHETGGYSINIGSTMDSLVTGFTTMKHTGDLIPVFAYGPGAEAFAGIYENTAIYHKMMQAKGWKAE